VSEREKPSEQTVRTLQVLLFAMAMGLSLLAAVVLYLYFKSAGVVPDPARVRADNNLTMVAMAVAAAAIVASEAGWRQLLRAGEGALSERVSSAFIVRAAAREGAGMMGLVAALLCAQHGVLRLYPAYWANFAPFGLFLVFAKMHWPTAESLAAEIAEILPQ
jgi:hypothetical protein